MNNNFLAVDTSSRYLTVLAKNGDNTVIRHLPECAMKHSVILLEEIDKTLEEAGLTLQNCGYLSVVTGPGSFTGIRIGVSAIKGLALAAGKPIKPVTAFELIAYNVNSGNFRVVIDAAHSHYYVCGYHNGEISFEPRYVSQEEIISHGGELYGFEDLPFANYKKLAPQNCLLKACERANISDSVHALYVRKSQAEENFDANKRVGL